MDLKHRAIQIWGYFALIVGCGCALMQLVALISWRRVDLRVYFLIVVLAAYLIHTGLRAITEARRSESGAKAITLTGEIWVLLLRCSPLFRRLTAKPYPLLIALGIAQAFFGAFAFLYLGGFILARAAYLGVAPLAVPALAFCLFGVICGVALIIRRDVGACRAVGVWNLVLGLFTVPAAFQGGRLHPQGIIAAAIFLGVFTILIVPVVPCRDGSR
jgi:hypothetical protein